MVRSKKDTTAQSAPAQMIIQELVKRPARIETTDINLWREAVNSAKSGWRTKLYNLYENLMSDPILADAVDKRINAITNAEISFLRDGKNVEEIDDLIDTPEFEELIREILLAKSWGKSVIEASFNPDFNVFSFPRKNIYIANMDKRLAERKRYIVEREGNRTGYDYSQDEFILECGKDDDLGFLFQAAPYVIYKRGGWGDWAEFAEVFGRHFIIGKYFGSDITTRDKLFAEIENIGSGLKAAIPKEADLEVIQNQTSGNNTLFNTFTKACDEQILIAVLGNLMTTLNGSSKSQAEVHQETQQDINKADRRYVQRLLNRWLVPLLVKRGYDAAGGYFSFPDQGESLTTSQRLDMAIKLKNDAKVPVSDDVFYEITGISKPEQQPPLTPPKERNKEASKGGEKQQKPGVKLIDKNGDPERGITLVSEGGFWKGFFDFFAVAPQAGAIRPNFIERSINSITGDAVFNRINLGGAVFNRDLNLADDGYSINIASLVDEALREIYNEPNQPLVNPKLFEITNNALQQAITVEVGKETAGWGKTNAGFINEFRNNTAVFSAFKNHQQTNEIVSLLTDENGNTRSFSKFKKLALEVAKDYNENWLQTEYNTAVRSARAAFNYKKYLETEHLYPNLEYLESTAGHKSEEHLTYVGTILPIRHPWWTDHMPPSRWNCQCGIKPTNKAITDVPADDEPIDPVFANNPGETAKMVNTEATPYYENTDEKLRAAIEDLAVSLEKMRQQLEDLELYKKFENGGSVAIFKKVDKTAGDYKKIVGICELEAKNGKTAIIYPRFDKTIGNADYERVFDALRGTSYWGKCPDYRINEIWWEHEGYDVTKDLSAPKTVKTTFRNMLSRGLGQSDRIVIEDCGISHSWAKRNIWARIHNENQQISEILVRKADGTMELLYKKKAGQP